MNLTDQIEAAEAPLDVVLPLDTELELQEHFHIHCYEDKDTDSSITDANLLL